MKVSEYLPRYLEGWRYCERKLYFFLHIPLLHLDLIGLVYGPSPEPTVLPNSENSVFIFVIYGHTQINVQTKMCLGLKQSVLKS